MVIIIETCTRTDSLGGLILIARKSSTLEFLSICSLFRNHLSIIILRMENTKPFFLWVQLIFFILLFYLWNEIDDIKTIIKSFFFVSKNTLSSLPIGPNDLSPEGRCVEHIQWWSNCFYLWFIWVRKSLEPFKNQ